MVEDVLQALTTKSINDVLPAEEHPPQQQILAEIGKDLKIYVEDFDKVVELDVAFRKLIRLRRAR